MSLPNVAEISLTKLKYNLNNVKKFTKTAKICAVVKSDAYGHGIVEIANALYNKVDCFAVSLESECVKLRQAGIDKEILLLTPVFKQNAKRLISLKITLTVTSPYELKFIYKNAVLLNKRASVHIKINSGMNRLGIDDVKDVQKCVNYAKRRGKFIKITGCYSHLGSPSNDEYSNHQLEVFKNLSKPVKEYNKNAVLHLSSSGGILKGKEYLFDMVRVGILLYGYLPYKTDKIKVKPIMKIKAKRLVNRYNIKNKHLMYGDNLSVVDGVSVIRLGYADGIFRSNTNGVIGNACMDLCATNLTNSSYVTIVSDVEKLAKSYGTISYEVLTNITKRSQRIYK